MSLEGAQLPLDWQVRRLRTVADLLVSNVDKESVASELPVRLCNYVDIYKNERIDLSVNFMRATATESEVRRFRLHVGDVVITKDSEDWQDIGVPALIAESADDLVCGYHLAIVRARPTEVSGKYLYWCLRSRPVAGEFSIRANGVTRFGLTHGAIKDIPLPIPLIGVQDAIVRFLEDKERDIERYLATKRRMIEELGAAKVATLRRIMECGSTVHVEGRLPQSWRRLKLRRVLRLQRGYDLPSDRRSEGSVPVYSSGGLIGTHNIARAPAPGVVMGRYGSTNAVFYVDTPFWPHNTSLFVTDFQGNLPRWCFYLLRSISKEEHSAKSAVPGVDRNDLYEIEVLVPPREEQQTLVDVIERELSAMDIAIGTIERETTVMEEYRNRLIADAVTGQIDVRRAT